MKRRWLVGLLCACCICSLTVHAVRARAAQLDPRIRVAPYRSDVIYRLRGYVGYEIDVSFAPGERFVGLGLGDAKGVTFAVQANHLFLKPSAAHVATDLTVITDRRIYLFYYEVEPGPPDPGGADVIYALRFEYPVSMARAASRARQRLEGDLSAARRDRPRNYDYWYCGDPSLKPVAAWDDGVETTLIFGARAELPAVFALNEDGSESLVNFNVQAGRMIIQRVARRLRLRRGKLAGCIVDRAFTGGGERLVSGTIAPNVERRMRRSDRVVEP